MAQCEFLERCPFYHDQLDNRPDDVEALKQKYCLSNNLNCARYVVANALGPSAMPSNLYPHEKERAYAVLAGA